MIKNLSLILLFTVTFISGMAQKKEEKLVRKSFESYKSAILNDKGEDAVNYVDNRTIKYYSDILDKTKNADSVELNSLGIIDKLMVFSIRHSTPENKILSFDGKGLLIYAIKEGMVGKNSVANNSVGEVEVVDNFAKGQLIANGKEAPFYFHFYKEDEIWKIDLTSIFPIVTVSFKKLQEESGQDENEYLFSLLEMVTGSKPGNDIWNTIE